MMERRVGMIGVGVMGMAMARNLLAAGYEVCGYDVSNSAADALAKHGGKPLPSPRAVADRCPILFLSLPSVDALAAVTSGPDGIPAAAAQGQIAIECSTLPLDAKRAAQDALAARDMVLLDCPLSGTGAQAAVKDLVVFASGDVKAYERCGPAFEAMSRRQLFLGAFGNGSVLKYIANLLVTIHNVAAGEAMVLGMKAGIDPAVIYDALAGSAGSSRMFEVRGPMMVEGRYEPATASVNNHLKDISIIDAFAAKLQCPAPLFAAASQIYFAGAARGRGRQDTASVCAVLEELAAVKRP